MPDTPEKCREHPDGLPVAKCLVCGKTVCSECVQARGYFCSDVCRSQHQQEQQPLSEEELRQQEKLDKQAKVFDAVLPWLFKRIPLAILVVVAAYLALRVADKSGDERWNVTAPGSTHFEAMALGKDVAYVLRDDGFCVAFNISDGSEQWSVPLDTGQCYGGSVTLVGSFLAVEANSTVTILTLDGNKKWSRKRTGFGRYDSVFGSTGILATGMEEDIQQPGGPEDITAFIDSMRNTETVFFLDIGTGETLWKIRIEQREVRKLIAGDHICISSSCIPGTYEFKPCPQHSEKDRLTAFECSECRYVETEDTDCRVEVFNTASGKRLWSVCPRGNSIEDVFLQDGRVIVVAGSEVYCLSREGKSFWTRSLPSTPGHSVLIPGKALVVVMAGRMLGLSLEDGADLWQCEVSGELWQLTAGPDSVYVMTAMEEIVDLEERRRRYEKSAPMSGQQKMARKLAGIQDEEDAELKSSMIIRRFLSVLANYDVANGKQRWNRENIRGDVHPFDNGFMLLQYIYGLDAAMSGTIPTYVNMLSASNGRRRWKTKLDTYVRAAALTGDSVVLITETTIRALRRRGFINRLTRF